MRMPQGVFEMIWAPVKTKDTRVVAASTMLAATFLRQNLVHAIDDDRAPE